MKFCADPDQATSIIGIVVRMVREELGTSTRIDVILIVR
jgi:hypothetical protein